MVFFVVLGFVVGRQRGITVGYQRMLTKYDRLYARFYLLCQRVGGDALREIPPLDAENWGACPGCDDLRPARDLHARINGGREFRVADIIRDPASVHRNHCRNKPASGVVQALDEVRDRQRQREGHHAQCCCGCRSPKPATAEPNKETEASTDVGKQP